MRACRNFDGLVDASSFQLALEVPPRDKRIDFDTPVHRADAQFNELGYKVRLVLAHVLLALLLAR